MDLSPEAGSVIGLELGSYDQSEEALNTLPAVVKAVWGNAASAGMSASIGGQLTAVNGVKVSTPREVMKEILATATFEAAEEYPTVKLTAELTAPGIRRGMAPPKQQ
eukprot:gene23390-54958_t